MTTHPAFSPRAANHDELDALTVGRAALLDTLVQRITGAARGGARPHTLLVAPRGGGKTHTVLVTVGRCTSDAHTAKHLLPVVLPEDSLAIGSYPDLLVELTRTVDAELGARAQRMRRDGDTVGIEQAIMAAAGGRMILLVVENLDRVFEALGEAGQGSLRAWVETSTAVLILATAPQLFPGVSSRSYPWYGSFMVETLPELSVPDVTTMLRRAAQRRGDDELVALLDSADGGLRVQAVHAAVGGTPRVWHILGDGIDAPALEAVTPAVRIVLDRLSPYYQQRLWQLPPAAQRLVTELARGSAARTVGELAAATGVSNQSAATALGRLTAAHWVSSTKAPDGDQRASWYDLTDSLLRQVLHYRERG